MTRELPRSLPVQLVCMHALLPRATSQDATPLTNKACLADKQSLANLTVLSAPIGPLRACLYTAKGRTLCHQLGCIGAPSPPDRTKPAPSSSKELKAQQPPPLAPSQKEPQCHRAREAIDGRPQTTAHVGIEVCGRRGRAMAVRPSDPAPPAAAPQQQALCDDWRLGQCRALGRATGTGAAQRAAADRILPSSRPGLPWGPPAVALGPEGRSGIVPPREKRVSPFFDKTGHITGQYGQYTDDETATA